MTDIDTDSGSTVSQPMREILTEMFRIVGAEYSDEFIQKENWWREYQWTEKQQDEFAKWVVAYLKSNKEARVHFFKRATVSNRVIRDSIGMFMFHCGWMFRGDEDEKE